jgi:hypothetical protein
MQRSLDFYSFRRVEASTQNCDNGRREPGGRAGLGAPSKRTSWTRAATLSLLGPLQLRLKRRGIIRTSTSVLLVVNLVLIATATIKLMVQNHLAATELTADSDYVESWPKMKPTISQIASRDTFDVISDRPLFEPSRRPVLPDSAPGLNPELVVQLIGTYLSDNGRTALVRLGEDTRSVWRREGEYIHDWQIEEIHAGRLQLRRIDERRIVHLWPDS